jgi:hypothetical protein
VVPCPARSERRSTPTKPAAAIVWFGRRSDIKLTTYSPHDEETWVRIRAPETTVEV